MMLSNPLTEDGSDRRIFVKYLIVVGASLMVSLLACAPGRPKIDAGLVEESIVGKSVDSSSGGWRFEADEVRRIDVIEVEYHRDNAIAIVSIDTIDPGILLSTRMNGRLRLRFEWIAERWELIGLENLSFRRI